MFVASYSVTYCIYIPGKPGICFHYYCAVYDECKYSDTFWLADRTRLFVQYTTSLSSLCKLIWGHWTYKMPVRYILSSVWVRLSILSLLCIIQYVGLYVFSLPISFVMIERIYILCLIIIIKSEVWIITHCLGLGHETMVSAVCLSTFFWIYICQLIGPCGLLTVISKFLIHFSNWYIEFVLCNSHHWYAIILGNTILNQNLIFSETYVQITSCFCQETSDKSTLVQVMVCCLL